MRARLQAEGRSRAEALPNISWVLNLDVRMVGVELDWELKEYRGRSVANYLAEECAQ